MPVHARGPVLLLALWAVLSGCERRDDPFEVLGTLERDRLELTAESNDRIVGIEVQEGAHVAAGTPLLHQQTDTISARLTQLQASVDESEKRLAELQHGPRPREIESARATLTGAESTLTTATREHERVRVLVERRLLSASQLDEASAQRDRARADRDAARASLKLLEEGTRKEQLQQATAARDRARAAVQELQVTAARYTILAPRDGTIEALPFEVGERPLPGATVVVVLADGAPFARVHVPEPLRAQFAPGVAVVVRADGVPEALDGKVRFIASQASFTPYNSLTQRDRSRLAFLAEIDVTDARGAHLPAGLPVQVSLREGSPAP